MSQFFILAAALGIKVYERADDEQVDHLLNIADSLGVKGAGKIKGALSTAKGLYDQATNLVTPAGKDIHKNIDKKYNWVVKKKVCVRDKGGALGLGLFKSHTCHKEDVAYSKFIYNRVVRRRKICKRKHKFLFFGHKTVCHWKTTVKYLKKKHPKYIEKA